MDGMSEWPQQYSALRGSDKDWMGLARGPVCRGMLACQHWGVTLLCTRPATKEEIAAKLQQSTTQNSHKERNHGRLHLLRDWDEAFSVNLGEKVNIIRMLMLLSSHI